MAHSPDSQTGAPQASDLGSTPEPLDAPAFSYREAFARNRGWLSAAEQAVLRTRRVAIAGLGGVGGAHLMTLVRLGVGKFRVADFDTFDFANFNRQTGAAVSTVGLSKTQVLASMARDVNPELELDRFIEGVDTTNVDQFLDQVDLYVDGLDFFAFEARAAVFEACARKAIPAITVAPLGMGAALLNFLPGQMTFEEYFGWRGQDETERALRFLVGLSPSFLHAGYLVDPSAVDFHARRGPSTGMACQLCAGIAGTEALKMLLGRGRVIAAPRGVHFDAYRNTLRITWRPGGNANPIQQLALRIARARYSGRAVIEPARAPDGTLRQPLPHWQGRPLEDIDHLVLDSGHPLNEPWRTLLDAARWAPSGDNTQPWRFEVVSAAHLVVHGFDTRHWCIYDIDGQPSRIALGAMLETLKIAAADLGLAADAVVQRDLASVAGGPAVRVDVHLRGAVATRWPVLAAAIRTRSVQRRALSRRPITAAHKRSIESAVAQSGPFACVWLEGAARQWAIARLLSLATWVRLTLPQAHLTHARVVQWGARYSEDRIPDQAIGLDALTLRLMRPLLAHPRLSVWVARFLGGTWAPRLALDWLPALCCGAHLAIVRQGSAPADGCDEDLRVGAAVQRAWLTAESVGLRMQPEMAAPIFAAYAEREAGFLTAAGRLRACQELGKGLRDLTGAAQVSDLVWLCRVGEGAVASARSLRLPLEASR